MNIDGLGVETIDQLYKNGLVKNAADIYQLQAKDLLPLERMAEKSVNNLIKSIEDSKQTPFERVLYALGIRFVGETVAKKLARHFGNIEAIKNASIEELESVDEIGPQIAGSVSAFFQQADNLILMERLQKANLNFVLSAEDLADKTEKLKGLSILVTGGLESFSRDEVKNVIEKNGGKAASSVTGKTDIVVVGKEAGGSKLEKAEKLGIKMIDEATFLKMIE